MAWNFLVDFVCYLVSYSLLCLTLQDYHNLRAAAFNSQARELTQKTADLTESRGKYFSFISRGGASAHPLGVVPEIRADC